MFRGFKVALLANDGFSKLLATGLTAVLALQVFVIVGGVTRVIPTASPFVSYGGSSIVANMVLLALLLISNTYASKRFRRCRIAGRPMASRLAALASRFCWSWQASSATAAWAAKITARAMSCSSKA